MPSAARSDSLWEKRPKEQSELKASYLILVTIPEVNGPRYLFTCLLQPNFSAKLRPAKILPLTITSHVSRFLVLLCGGHLGCHCPKDIHCVRTC